MRIMADLDAVHLGLDENEADIAEELQDFDDSFDTRSEASESASESSDSQPSISSVSTDESSVGDKRKNKTTEKKVVCKENVKKNAVKRTSSPGGKTANGKNANAGGKKKRNAEDSSYKVAESSSLLTKVVESKIKEKKTQKKANTGNTSKNSSTASSANINGPANTSSGSISAHANTSGNKSDISDAEDKPMSKAPFDSDSESEDSDSAANIKRNGRKAVSKSVSPEKKIQSGSNNSGGKSYDYMTKLNYLFRGTHFFLIKSNNADNVGIAKSKNVWATLPQNEANLNQAFKESRNVLLIFSVNESGKFAGFARMSAQSRRDLPHPAWVLPPSISAKALGGIIELDWICRKELSFNCTSHLYNTWNEGKPVKIGRDGQEIEPKVGAELCRLFPEDEKIEMTPILRKSKETAKMMREKGIRVTYRPPRSLSTRGRLGGGSHSSFLNYRQSDRRAGGSSSGGRNSGGGGPIRHGRTFGVAPHRPYKLPPLGMPPGSGFKRSSSPYRSVGSGGPGSSGGSRAGGGDASLPSWDRYMNSAEAYMMDYMRSMHGQLPPLPFVPPFAQLPLSASSSGALPPPGPPSMYDQLPPPVRYYDGPPLPDYPPPQPIRPPPPGFDKAPSYEDFAAWKNAGLPTLPDGMPPGFPNFSSSQGASASNGGNSGISGSNSGGGSGGAGGGNSFSSSNNALSSSNTSGPNAFRSQHSQRANNSNIMRPRERPGGRDYRGPSGSISVSRNTGNDRHFRPGAGSSGGARNYRDGRR